MKDRTSLHAAIHAVKRMLLGFEPRHEYVAIGLRAPQREVKVVLCGLGAPRDVTFNHSIASLRPLVIAIGSESPVTATALNGTGTSLVFESDMSPARELGRIRLRLLRRMTLDDGHIAFFETTGYQNHCFSAARVRLNHWYRRWEARRRPRHDLRANPAERECAYVLYICPRPVVLVSAVWRDGGNLFPMDLLGPLLPNRFVLALRSTNPSVRLMREARHIALASIPLEWKDIAYTLGNRHRQQGIDWDQLGFQTMPSPECRLPVPRAALSVREVWIERVETVGSHAFFVTRTLREHTYASGTQLHHIHEFYDHWRRRQQREQ